MNILEYENYQEKIPHGNPLFPYITYPCSIPLDFERVPLHWHDEMEIIYIKKGSAVITVDFAQYRASAGTLALILPGQLHSIEQYEQECVEYENIIFHPNILVSKQADTGNTDLLLPLISGGIAVPLLYTPDAPHYREIVGCIDANDEISRTNPPGYQLFIKSQLLMLFFILIHKCRLNEPQKKDYKSLEKMKLILKYIENHYMDKITIADMAEEVGLSQSHFMKYFKNTMGASFIDYLNEYRLTMASRLLIASDASILSIAEEVGYENLSYFNRTFKKRFHMTPGAYRKACAHN
ncbi:MAG: AraC family transcriptional regulator [Roseburia sp.]